MSDRPAPAAQIRFSAWWRGGEPGPDNASDLIEITVDGDSVAARYTAARFRFSPGPGYETQAWQGSLPIAMWKAIAQAIVDEGVFTRRWPSEARDRLADAVRLTLTLEVADTRYEKTFHESGAMEFASTKSLIRAAMEHVRATGTPVAAPAPR